MDNQTLTEIHTCEGMVRIRDGLRNRRTRIHLVPTMGALHKGHEFLIKEALKLQKNPKAQSSPTQQKDEGYTPDQVVIVSIFVNPIQFNSSNDLFNYPKPLEKDLEICKRLGVQYVFIPRIEDIYPDGHEEGVMTTVQGNFFIQYQLEGMSRPGHFTGMLTIVNKLFNIIGPNEAFFGEKDYQQLLLVKRMVKDLNMGVIIRGVETVREEDGLPLSSRNIRIQETHRPSAAMMSEVLFKIKDELEKRSDDWLADITDDKNQYVVLKPMMTVFTRGLDEQNVSGFIENVDYFELRCAEDLGNIEYIAESGGFDCEHKCLRKYHNQLDRLSILECRLLAAIVLGGVRLLDNVKVSLNQDQTIVNNR